MAYGQPGRPISTPRSSAAERRQQREDFKRMKEELANSPEEVARREKLNVGKHRSKVRQKIKVALNGEAVWPFTAQQLTAFTAKDIRELYQEVRSRLGKL